MRSIHGESNVNHHQALAKLYIESLAEQRENLCLNLQLNVSKIRKMLICSQIINNKCIKSKQKYEVQFAHTDRYNNSPVIYMQRILNSENS